MIYGVSHGLVEVTRDAGERSAKFTLCRIHKGRNKLKRRFDATTKERFAGTSVQNTYITSVDTITVVDIAERIDFETMR